MEPSSTTSELKKLETCSTSWILKNWSKSHETFATGKASCVMAFKEQNLKIRLFLQPTEKSVVDSSGATSVLYYSLCGDVIHKKVNGIVAINANVPVSNCPNWPSIIKDGKFDLNGYRKGTPVVIIEDFLVAKLWYLDGGVKTIVSGGGYRQQQHSLFQMPELTTDLKASLFQFTNSGNPSEPEINGSGDNQTEPEMSMLQQLKNMYLEEDNFSDLKLETKDNMTLSAHKFQLSARSPVFRKIIEGEVKKNGFDGTIKIADVNAKALIVILHWIYTGEVHENLGKVMEEVVKAAVTYQLMDMLKMLDKKVIEIVTTDNMFQLFQVAKKIPLPTAVEDIAGFIKGNL